MSAFTTTMSYWLGEETGLVKARANEAWVETKPKQSTRMNAMWKEGRGLSPSLPDAQYFEFTIAEAPEGASMPVSIGLTDEKNFGAGWSFKGLSYGGNLSDGSSLLAQGFGPSLKQGDVVGLRAEMVERKNKRHDLEVYISVNGEGLGKAFSIDEFEVINVGPLYPTVGFSTGPAKVVIERKSAPSAEDLSRPSSSQTRESVHGAWVAPAASIVGEDTDELPPVVIKVVANEANLGVQAKVANSISSEVSLEAPHKSTGSPAISTKMMPPPKVLALEERVAEVITSIQNLELVDGQLKLSYGEGDSVHFEPYDAAHDPISAEQIKWMQRTDQ
ncbi:Ran-binding protein 9 [Hondaea fermentalgiana]|uniref:Ran-binding protein 9 n=1 Tax=Hondaea fermentalgiana TaxID=2315210 RepID=A0A2R5GKC3_9STRA|nr:Ran-binding protein 9 [Hondaea fermentalgiana]|eukprot:GBG30178.1 Ran-binding protein 9 [Hondaea fermentalgiana]